MFGDKVPQQDDRKGEEEREEEQTVSRRGDIALLAGSEKAGNQGIGPDIKDGQPRIEHSHDLQAHPHGGNAGRTDPPDHDQVGQDLEHIQEGIERGGNGKVEDLFRLRCDGTVLERFA